MNNRQKKILVVEDSEFVRENLVILLEINNYSTLSAENGHIAYISAIDELPDLIISDVMMPVVNGFELLQKIRSYETTAEIPFVFLSAKSSFEEIQDGIGAGANAYITKPYNAGKLIETVNSLLKN